MIVPADPGAPDQAAARGRLAVMGGCGGIGRPLVEAATSRGLQVAVLDLPQSIERHPPGETVAVHTIDATDSASTAAAFARIESDWGALDGFVNLCGFMHDHQGTLDLEEPDWTEAVSGNLTAVYTAARYAMPLLAQGQGASMVNTASGLASHTRPGYGAYAASKAGVISLTKTLALEHAPGVRVNAVAPAAVDTAFLRGGTGRSNEDAEPHVDIDAYTRMTPLQRMATPADIIDPIFFLLGNASRYMTGQVLWVNGGNFMP